MEAPEGNPMLPAALAVTIVALVVVISIGVYLVVSTTAL
jgi:hypothetical protein